LELVFADRGVAQPQRSLALLFGRLGNFRCFAMDEGDDRFVGCFLI
jgi:hypothetical protein